MKRALIGVLVVVGLGVLASSAAAAGKWSIDLHATHASATSHSVLLNGDVLKPNGKPAANQAIVVTRFTNATCTAPGTETALKTDKDGGYALDLSLSSHATYSFWAALTGGKGHATAIPSCVVVTVAPAAGEDTGGGGTQPGGGGTQPGGGGTQPGGGGTGTPVAPTVLTHGAGTYLCWNREMVDPVAYEDKVADVMWATGSYFEPFAILGSLVGGTNIGAYHLICNGASTLVDTGYALGGSGEVYGPDAVAAYHTDHPVNSNDLNIYHIYK